jgi:hypothetical protein
LAAAIEKWLSLSAAKKERLSIKARQTIEARYSEKAVLPRILEVYNKAMQPYKTTSLPATVCKTPN